MINMLLTLLASLCQVYQIWSVFDLYHKIVLICLMELHDSNNKRISLPMVTVKNNNSLNDLNNGNVYYHYLKDEH